MRAPIAPVMGESFYFMRFLLIAGSGTLCAILGGTLAGLIGDCYTRWFHVSQREGGAGYLVAFLILAGGIAGLVTGLITGVANDTFLRGLGVGSAVILSVAAVAFLLCYTQGDIPPTSGFRSLDLEAEIRMPDGAKLTNRMKANGASASLIRVKEDGSDGYSSADHGMWSADGVAKVRMRIFASKGGWKVKVFDRADELAVFPGLDLGSLVPGKEWSEWQVSSTGYKLRRRIQPEGPAIVEQEKEPELKALPALDPKGPLEPWLVFLDGYYKGPRERYADQAAAEELRLRTMQVLTGRPDDVISLLKAAGPGNMHLSELAVQSLNVPESFGAPLRGILPRFEEAVRVYRKESPREDPDILRAKRLKDDFQVWCNLWERFQAFHPDAERPNLDGLEKEAREAPENDPIRDMVSHIESYREYTLKRN